MIWPQLNYKLCLMNKIYYCFLLFVVLFSSCNNSEKTENVHIIDVTNPEQVELEDIFSELEVLHMKAGVKSFVPNANYVQKCGDNYIFTDSHKDVYVFDKQGGFISSSKSVHGKGHGEFTIRTGWCYNPYLNNIIIVTPLHLMFYDMNFKYVKSVQLPSEYPNENNNNTSLFFEHIFALSDHLWALISSSNHHCQKLHTMFIFDSEKREIIDEICYDEDVIYGGVSQVFPFQTYDEDNLLFFPPQYSKYVYKFDKKEQNLQRFTSFKYGDDFYLAEELEKFKHDTNREGFKYMSKNHKKYPIRIYYNDESYYLSVSDGPRIANGYMYIIDSKTDKVRSLSCNKDGKIQFYDPSFVSDGIVYATMESEFADSLIQAFPGKVTEINKYKADSTVNDNIVVLKYHLK